MYVCLCEGITDRRIRSLAHQGCHSVAEVSKECGAGSGCGQCRLQVRRLLLRERGPDPREHESSAK